MGFLVNEANPAYFKGASTGYAVALALGQRLGIDMLSVNASTPSDVNGVFRKLAEKGADALLVSPDTLFFAQRVELVASAAENAIPVCYFAREFVEIGGLMSYGSDLKDQFRQTGIYAGRILKGEKPAEMPVQLPTKFEFVLNLQAAKTLGLEVPSTLLARADEVIE